MKQDIIPISELLKTLSGTKLDITSNGNDIMCERPVGLTINELRNEL